LIFTSFLRRTVAAPTSSTFTKVFDSASTASTAASPVTIASMTLPRIFSGFAARVVPSSYRATLSPVCTTPLMTVRLPVPSPSGCPSGNMMMPAWC
jgi:hypothetical protein